MPSPTETKPKCSRCGIETAHQIGGVIICDDCYIACGSCCADD